MSAEDKIRHGLALVAEGLTDLREEEEILAYRLAQLRALDVDTEMQLRTCTTRALAARRPRHLVPTENAGPRRLLADGGRTITMQPELDARTAASLRTMGLTPIAVSPEERSARRAAMAKL